MANVYHSVSKLIRKGDIEVKLEGYLAYIVVDRQLEQQSCSNRVSTSILWVCRVGTRHTLISFLAKRSQKVVTRPTHKKRNIRRDDATFDYSDLAVSSSLTTTATSYKVLSPILGTDGILPNFPFACARPVILTGPYMAMESKVHIRSIEVWLNFVGSQSNTIAAGDLFNRVRVVIVGISSAYTTALSLTPSIDSGLDMRDLERVYLDQVITLSSTAFDVLNSYNVPATKFLNRRIGINKDFSCFSTTTPYNVWDSRLDSIGMFLVSDSSVAPNPTVTGHIRVHYKLVTP